LTGGQWGNRVRSHLHRIWDSRRFILQPGATLNPGGVMNGIKILIVAGNEADRALIEQILTQHGYLARTAEADRVKGLLEREIFDIVMVDLDMENDQGTRVLSQVLECCPLVKTIAMTSRKTFETALNVLRLHMHDLLLMPLTNEELLGSLERVLTTDGKHLRDGVSKERYDFSTKPYIYQLQNNVQIDIRKHIVQWDDHLLVLTPTETIFLQVLLERHNELISYTNIVMSMHGYKTTEKDAAAVLRTIVSRLRKKIDQVPGGDKWIHTVRGAGYCFEGKLEG